ncbi:MAG: rhodanese-like domain-containing protein [Flavobacteriales bacterium]|nr:rhodanese-like domain-containing protein [Flavobacteriales bacterium]
MKTIAQTTTILLMSIFMFSCTNGQNKTADGAIAENVNVEQFSVHIKDAQILDVRTPDEWSQGIMEGANMYNFYDDDFSSNLEKLDKEKPVAVYCKVGGRSGKAMKQLKKLGFKEVYNLDGGMDAWKNAEKPTVKP